MIQVDISNVWGAFALPEFLEMEQAVSDAHKRLTESENKTELTREEWKLAQAMGRRIRQNFEICVVIGTGEAVMAARGILELLQGSSRNLHSKPALVFAGSSFSSTQLHDLTRTLEGRDYCLLAVGGREPETALTLRTLRWMLERRYGCEGAKIRGFAVTDISDDPITAMARQAQWECMECAAADSPITGPAFVILEAAGVDTNALADGMKRAGEAMNLRSFENPAWLYGAARALLSRKGKTVEVLETAEPDFSALGLWWQRQSAGSTLTVSAAFPAQAGTAEAFLQCGSGFVTRLRFAEPINPIRIVPDLLNADGLNPLAGWPLDAAANRAMESLTEYYQDRGISVIGIDCGTLEEGTLGELLFFIRLSRDICAGIPSENGEKPSNTWGLSEELLRQFTND